MYNINSISKRDVSVLSSFSFLEGWDAAVSVVETRSIQHYLFNNLRYEFDRYINDFTFLEAVQGRYDNILQRYGKIRQIPKIEQEKEEIKRRFELEKKVLSVSLRNRSIEDFFLQPEPIEVSDLYPDIIRERFLKNSKDGVIHTYIVNGKIGSNQHWFFLFQDKKKIFSFDSVGFETRKDFAEKFVITPSFDIVLIKTPLQYGGNDCEGFANILPNYIMRLILFNQGDYNNIDAMVDYTTSTVYSPVNKSTFFYELRNIKSMELLSLFADGLNESAFGNVNEHISAGNSGIRHRIELDLSSVRMKMISEQISAMNTDTNNGIVRFKRALFGANQQSTFQDLFLADLTKSLDLLQFLISKNSAKLSDLVEVNMSIASKSHKIWPVLEKEKTQKAITYILENHNLMPILFFNLKDKLNNELNKLLSDREIINFVKKLLPIKENIDEKEVIKFLYLLVSNNYDNLVVKELIKKQKVDFSNPKMSLPAGHIYWKTLEYVEMFDRRVTRHILNNENFSEETKKSMLSAIYPYHYNFSVVENGDNYVYLAIDRYYNSDLYSSVAESVLQIKIPFSRFVSNETEIFKKIVSSQDTLENLPHFIAWNRNFREDIFRHVATANDKKFNQKIIPFFFETKEVDKDYVRVVAGKYTFSMINEKDNTTDYSQIGKDFAHMLIIAEGNDRNDTFNTAIEKGKVLLHSNYHFRTGVFNWVLNKPTVGIKIKVSSMPVFNYIKNDDKEKDMFIKRLNIQRYLSSAATIDINTIKPLTEDMIFVFDTLLSSKSFNYSEGDIDDFSEAILDKVEKLKATVTSMQRQQSAAMAMAKPAAPKETEASAVRPKKKTSQEQQPPVEEKSEEELTLKVWEQFKNKIDGISQKFPDLTNLKKLHESI